MDLQYMLGEKQKRLESLFREKELRPLVFTRILEGRW